MKNNQKLYIVKKYVMANNASDAIKREKNQLPDDVFMEEKWMNAMCPEPPKKDSDIGFKK